MTTRASHRRDAYRRSGTRTVEGPMLPSPRVSQGSSPGSAQGQPHLYGENSAWEKEPERSFDRDANQSAEPFHHAHHEGSHRLFTHLLSLFTSPMIQ